MRVVIAGAGSVGRSIAAELLDNGHQVLLIDRSADAIRADSLPGADWLHADACEIDALEEADLAHCDVSIAATGDDKANLVHSLLARTEFGVPRTVGRVNSPGNEWMFDEVWGVDVAVSTPRMMSALVEEAVSVGDLVSLFSVRSTELVGMHLPADSPVIGRALSLLSWPGDVVPVAVIHGGQAAAPTPTTVLHAGDEILFLVAREHHAALAQALNPRPSV